MTAFLDVVLRGVALVGQALAAGGIIFLIVVLRTGGPAGPQAATHPGRSLSLMTWGAVGLALAQLASLLLHLAALADERGWPVGDALATMYFRAGLVRVAAAVVLALAAARARRTSLSPSTWAVLVASGVALFASSAGLSHAAARLDHVGWLLVLDTLHQLGASAWVGGLAHLAAIAFGLGPSGWPATVLTRFSTLALSSVALLVGAGLGLSLGYVDGLGGLLGTSYGVMVLVKVVMLLGLLALGSANFFVVRRLADGPPVPLGRVQRFVEVELGLGLTVLFAAASLTSLPPAIDLTEGRATLAEVALRFTPRVPSFTSPDIESMPVEDREAPRTAEDREWSEFNHHVSGIIVLTMGLLAIVHRMGWGRWARHWPLMFLPLSVFMLIRNDPGSWPLGPQGFWEGLAYTEVVQHRLFVVLVVGFGLFEWMVRSGRIRSAAWAHVFPVLCAVGGLLLLTHSHASLNVKEEFLTEVTHAPLGLLALAAGWGRWLELRLPPPEDRWPGRLWAMAFVLIGGLLIIYRET